MKGLKVIIGTQVHEARDMDEAARLIAEVYPKPVRVRVRVTLTSDRDLTHEETLELADLAAAAMQ